MSSSVPTMSLQKSVDIVVTAISYAAPPLLSSHFPEGVLVIDLMVQMFDPSFVLTEHSQFQSTGCYLRVVTQTPHPCF